MEFERVYQGWAAIGERLGTNPRRAQYLGQTGQISVFWIGRTPCMTEQDVAGDIEKYRQAGDARRAKQQTNAAA